MRWTRTSPSQPLLPGSSPTAEPRAPAAPAAQTPAGPLAPSSAIEDTSSDEALARELQQQLDAQQWGGTSAGDSGTGGSSGGGGAVAQPSADELQQRHSGAGNSHGSVALAHNAPSPVNPPAHFADLPPMRRTGSGAPSAPPPTPVSPPTDGITQGSQPGSVTLGQRPGGDGGGRAGMLSSLGAAMGGVDACGGCGKPVRLWQAHAAAGGCKYHSWCLACAQCGQQIQVRGDLPTSALSSLCVAWESLATIEC